MAANYIPQDLLAKFEFHSYGHALEILGQSFPNEWHEILDSLRKLDETNIPKKFDDVLYPYGWREIRITGDLIVKIYPRQASQRGRFSNTPFDEKTIVGYIDGHNIDFIKGKVAFDLEWNSKDQTFDRDLLAMRTYFDCGLIDVGIIVTRSEELNDVFRQIIDDSGKSILRKYGASTTWMNKLLYRLDSRRNGGCPIMAIGIKRACVKGDFND